MSVRNKVRSLVLTLVLATALTVGAPGANASIDTVRGGQSGLFVPFANV